MGEGIFDFWVVELPPVDGALPRDAEEQNGLCLIDGADPCCGQVPGDDGEDSAGDSD